MNIEKIYGQMPEFLQTIAIVLQGRKVSRRRYAEAFGLILDGYLEREFWPQEKILIFKQERLHNTLAAASETAGYRNLWKSYKVNAQDVKSIQDVSLLPIIDKQFVRTEAGGLWTSSAKPVDIVWGKTSGTSGQSLRVKQTKESERHQWATWWRYRISHGAKLKDWHGNFGGKQVLPISREHPPFWRMNPFMNQIYFSNSHLEAKHLGAYCEEIVKRDLRFLSGYPSLINIVAQYVKEHPRAFPSLRAVFFGAETVLAAQRRTIQEAFGIVPRTHYGQVEGVANISECPSGKFHVDEDFSLVEFIPLQKDSNLYRIVGTSLWNSAMPFLRYDTGDLVTLPRSEELCVCGRKGRIVTSIEGRRDDLIVTRDGRKVACINQILKHSNYIREAQIRQQLPGKIEFHYIPLPGYTSNEESELRYLFQVRLGVDMEVDFKRVDAIPRTASGKLRMVISEVANTKSFE